MPKSPKTKKIVTPEKDLIVPVGDMTYSSPLEHEADKAPKETAMDLGVKIMNLVSESGTTEAEYQEPAVRVDPVEREYPDLRQDIPKILKAILRELVIARCGK